MSGKHSENLSISAGVLNLLPNFLRKAGGLIWSQFLDEKNEIFQEGGAQFLHKHKLKSEIFNEKKVY